MRYILSKFDQLSANQNVYKFSSLKALILKSFTMNFFKANNLVFLYSVCVTTGYNIYLFFLSVCLKLYFLFIFVKFALINDYLFYNYFVCLLVMTKRAFNFWGEKFDLYRINYPSVCHFCLKGYLTPVQKKMFSVVLIGRWLIFVCLKLPHIIIHHMYNILDPLVRPSGNKRHDPFKKKDTWFFL